jgi:cytochrome c oxidase assembly factor CtaG
MRSVTARRIALAALAWPALADAHASEAGPASETAILAALAVAAALYAIGAIRLLHRTQQRRMHRRRAVAFAIGWLCLAGALVSPLHAAGARSFAAHMLEHEMLMLAAAPALVLARPLGTFAWSLPRSWLDALGRGTRSRGWTLLWHGATEPVAATTLQIVALWAWHAPLPFDLALEHPGWHAIQHMSFLATALLFWTSMLDEHRLQSRPGTAIACLFATALVSGALGALMAISRSPWYEAYASMGITPAGLTPAEDQQLAGLLMWIPGGLVHTVAALAIAARALAGEQERA